MSLTYPRKIRVKKVGDMNDKFVAFLLAKFKEYEEETGEWRPSIVKWAHYLGVSEASLDHWLMGRRTPDIPNAIRLARKLGPEVYDLLGYEHYVQLDDPMLRLIAENWEMFDDETKITLRATVEKSIGRNEPG